MVLPVSPIRDIQAKRDMAHEDGRVTDLLGNGVREQSGDNPHGCWPVVGLIGCLEASQVAVLYVKETVSLSGKVWLVTRPMASYVWDIVYVAPSRRRLVCVTRPSTSYTNVVVVARSTTRVSRPFE